MDELSARATDGWAQLEPYAQLLTALVPRAAGVELYDPAAELRWSSGSDNSADLSQLISASIARAAAHPAEPGERLVMPGGVPAYLFWLRAESTELVAALAIVWRESDPEPRAFSLLQSLVRPALECLRRELLARGNIQRLSRALTARDRDLEMLLATTGEAAGSEGADELGSLLQNATSHLDCSFSALMVPEKSLVLVRHAVGSGEAADKQALAQTHRHLISVAQRRPGPVILNKLPEIGGKAPLPYRVLSCPVRHPTGRTMGVLALYRSAAHGEFVEREAQLTDLLARRASAIIEASYDALTGLLNRQAFEQRVRIATTAAHNANKRWSGLYVDVDQLHVINDNCGMHVGDRVIAQIGELIRARLVPGAFAARISGDRFALLLPSECEAAAAFADSLRIGVSDMPAGTFGAQGDARVAITVSIGVAPMGPGEEFSHFAVVAETACKAAKDRGRNRVEVYQNTDLSLVRRYEDVNIVPNLRMAMNEDRLRLEAQLIVPMQPGNACWHFELLLRMIDNQGITVGPERFLSAAVRYQFMPTIDRWVVQRAIAMLQPHAELLATRPVVFTINLSGQSVNEPGFADFLIQALSASGLNPAIFCFELTESAAVGNLATAEGVMRRLRELGCTVALDDFGTGLSSLAYLRSLPIDMLKIDGSFVRDILKDPRAESMVRAIAHLARAMDLTTVAEYVETDEIRLRIAALGVDYGQGFAIARPVPFAEVLAELPMYVAAEPVLSGESLLGATDSLPDGIVLLLDDEPPRAASGSL